MAHRVSIVITTCGRPAKLARCLEALMRQRLPTGVSMEVLVAVDGGGEGDEYENLARPPETRVLLLPRAGMGASRNAAIKQAQGDLIISTNDDTYPQPDWVAEHTTAHRLRGEPGMVVGLTKWYPWPEPTVFDGLLRDTSMIFFFHRMQPGEMYGFRHAWGCNTSVPTALARAIGGYEERLRPYGYEDLEFAFRLEKAGHPGVLFHPEAVNVHDHRITWRDYCNREACLGRMAPCLWEINPACFEAIFHRRDAEAMRRAFAGWLEWDRDDHQSAADEMTRWAGRSLGDVPDWDTLCSTLYRLHLPVKRRCFREGFIKGFELRHDDQWRDRLALGHGFP